MRPKLAAGHQHFDFATMAARQETSSGKKLVPLEGLRGIAAAIVVLYHLVLGFTPKGVGAVPHGHGWFDVVIQWFLGFLNGGAAVAVFFVLSGFILSLPFARDRRVSRILVATLKRWPRLALMTLIACVFALALIRLSGTAYQSAAAAIGTGWLASHGNAPLTGHHLTWLGAVREGLFSVFATGDVHFDSPLWTMRIELFGSFAIFLAAPILFATENWAIRLALIGGVMVWAGGHYPITYLSDFLVGTLLAMLFVEDRLPSFSNWQAVLAGVLALYLFSFTYEQKLLIDAPLKAIMPPGDTSHYVWDAGAVLMILLLLGNPALRRAFSGSWAIWLGLLSFPIYLLHGPIMLSAGAASFLVAQPLAGQVGAAVVAAAISIALTLACALPLVWVDKAWTGMLSRFFTRWTGKKRSDQPDRTRIPAKLRISGEQNEAFRHGLGDQHPVERVFMEPGERTDRQGVSCLNGQRAVADRQ
jgi:peptidoglycan/LPS O-acetylase OafA/YrhL